MHFFVGLKLKRTLLEGSHAFKITVLENVFIFRFPVLFLVPVPAPAQNCPDFQETVAYLTVKTGGLMRVFM